MFCIHCGHKNTKVTNSRPHKKRATIWRRRTCTSCGAVFTTLELVADENTLRIGLGQKSEKFSLPRLLVSLFPHLSERNTAADDAMHIAQTTYEHLLLKNKTKVDTRELVSATYEVLERFDRNAALKYALHYGMISLPSRQRRK